MEDVPATLVAIPAPASTDDVVLRTGAGTERTMSPLEFEYLKLSLHSLLGDDLKGDASAGGLKGDPPIVLAMRELNAAAGELHALGNMLSVTKGIGGGRNTAGVAIPPMFDTISIAARPPPAAWAAQTAARAHATKIAALQSVGQQLLEDAGRFRAGIASRRSGIASLRALAASGWRVLSHRDANEAAAAGHILVTKLLHAVRHGHSGSMVKLLLFEAASAPLAPGVSDGSATTGDSAAAAPAPAPAAAAASSLRVLPPVPHVLCLPPAYTQHASFATLPITSRMLAPLVTAGGGGGGGGGMFLPPTATEVRVVLPPGHSDTMLYVSVQPADCVDDPAVVPVVPLGMTNSALPAESPTAAAAAVAMEDVAATPTAAAAAHRLDTVCWRVARSLAAEMAADVLVLQTMQLPQDFHVREEDEAATAATAAASATGAGVAGGAGRKRKRSEDATAAGPGTSAGEVASRRVGTLLAAHADESHLQFSLQVPACDDCEDAAVLQRSRRFDVLIGWRAAYDEEDVASFACASATAAWAQPIARSLAGRLAAALPQGPLPEGFLQGLLRTACREGAAGL